MSYDLILVNTHRQYGFENSAFREWQGVHLLAAYMEEQGYSARVLSGFVHEIEPLLMSEIDSGLKVLGFTCDYENQEEVIQLSRRCLARRYLPILIGGPQAVVLGKDFLQKSGALTITRGEGELPLLALMQLLIDGTGQLKDVPGIVYLQDGRECKNPPPSPISNLDALPFPDPSLSLLKTKKSNTLSILTARGCPFRCSFCYEGSNTRSVRWRSVENVMQEIEQKLNENPQISLVLFTDDSFTINHSRVRDFCEALSAYRRKRDFCWFAEAHPRTLLNHPEILPIMIDAGLGCLQIGVESGDTEILRAYNKKTTPALVERTVELCQDAGVPQMMANIIVGGAFESEKSIKKSEEFGLRLLEKGSGMLDLNAIFFWPLPKTDMTMRPHEYGIEILDPHSLTSVTDYPVVRCGKLSPEMLSELRYDMEQSFSLKIKKLAARLPTRIIEKILKYWNKYGLYSRYVENLIHIDRYHRFSRLLENGAVFKLKDISVEEIGSWHPQRQCRPVTRKGIPYADDIPIDEEAYKVLVASSGRMTVDEASVYCGMSRHKFLDVAKRLENIMALAFCRY